MIEGYFSEVEHIFLNFSNIRSLSIKKKIYNTKQGYISGAVIFNNGYRLDFTEIKDIDIAAKIKYRYQYMDDQQVLIFRYDNAPHHHEIQSFPHHKHDCNEIKSSTEPKLFDVLLEIAQREREL